VARVPAEVSGGPGAGVQLYLQGVEGFSTGEAKALRCVAREAVGGSKQRPLAVDQENCVRVVRDQAESVYQAPEFGEEGVGRAVNPASEAPPGGTAGHTGGEGAVEA
jgi:hypothetical protein